MFAVLTLLIFRMESVLSATSFETEELSLLQSAAKPKTSPKAETEALSTLAHFYSSHARWDEYSSVRARMLRLYQLQHPEKHGPPPGGPFPRIGIPTYTIEETKPRSLLSRWLNREKLPELYTKEPPDQTALSVSLGQQFIGHCGEDNLITAKNLERMAALFCASIKFSDAEPLYSRAFTIRKKSAQKVSDGSFIEDYIALLRILGKDKEAAELQKQKGKR